MPVETNPLPKEIPHPHDVGNTRLPAQTDKAKNLQRAEVWLTGSVGYLVFLLFSACYPSRSK
jgi:hypothetical protein